MLIQLHTRDWKVLRALVRAKGRPVPGAKLRPDMGRYTKDGTFLTKLVQFGLLAVAEQGGEPFTSTYVLTESGRHAAEYGEHEVPWELYKRLTEKPQSPSATPAGEGHITAPAAVAHRIPAAGQPTPPGAAQSPAASPPSGARPEQSAGGPKRPRRK